MTAVEQQLPNDTDHETEVMQENDGSPSTVALVTGAYRRLRTTPRTLVVLFLAGLVVTGVDWLRLHDPIPTVGYVGI